MVRRAAPLAASPLLALLLACWAAAAAAAGPTMGDSGTCVLIRFLDRNMTSVEQAAHSASGHQGAAAGAYLRPEQVADLSGRTQAELDAMAAFIRRLGGRMEAVGPLRDLAAACFPTFALLELSAARGTGEPSKAQQEVMDATRTAISHHHDLSLLPVGAIAAAHSLAAAIPSDLAHAVAYIEPTAPKPKGDSAADAPSSGTGGRSLLQAGGADPSGSPSRTRPITGPRGVPPSKPTFGSGGEAGIASSFPDWQPVAGELKLDLPSGYGPALPWPVGMFNGWADPATNTAWGIPQFSYTNSLYFYGIRDEPTILNNINTESLATALMLPCQLEQGPGHTITGVTYATKATAAACMGSFRIRFQPVYAGAPARSGPFETSPVLPSAISVMSCGEAVARSRGRLPPTTCWTIGQQLAAATNISAAAAPITNDTAIYVVDLAQALPTYTGLSNVTVSVDLAPSAPAYYRSFGPLQGASFVGPESVAGRNRPADLLPLYDAAYSTTGAARGLLAGVSLFVPSPYAYSPKDLLIANHALGAPFPRVINTVNAPMFPANKPATCFLAGNDCMEPSLDIQQISQFGQGSGAAFGFAASSNASAYDFASLSAVFRGLLNLKPLPDVISWSWGNVDIQGKQLKDMDAILAKFAAMGVTVLASSGDMGAFYADRHLTAKSACKMPIAPSYPAASKWVTAVGAVMEARTAAGRAPELVACVSGYGGLITSGGGFGNVSLGATPAWQKQAVQKYISAVSMRPFWPLSKANVAANGAQGSVKCNAANKCAYGRAYPDIALVGAAVPVMVAGSPVRLYGTSVTAPAMAGLVMQLNAAIRSEKGSEKCRIGYMNPFLYWAAEKYPAAFRDITVGANTYNEKFGADCRRGYHAAPGWDAVTGLGVPQMRKLQAAAVEYVRLQLASGGKCA